MSAAKVTVLLATHNGSKWLPEQLSSIDKQSNVQVCIVASDDGSRDDTLSILKNWTGESAHLNICATAGVLGSAGKNFYHLMAHADVGDAQFVALSDQDDVWESSKLRRAIDCLKQSNADGYSSNFWAWYPHRTGQRQCVLINKAQPQVPFDHLFQGPGPGCTFVLTRSYFEQWRTFLLMHWDATQSVFFHDWLIYAHARSTGKTWFIDVHPTLFYRQHDHNVAGASRGWRAALKRASMMRQGWLGTQILTIAKLLGQESLWPIQAIERLALLDRLKLTLHVTEFRRSRRDQLALAIALLFLLPSP